MVIAYLSMQFNMGILFSGKNLNCGHPFVDN
jgi:hypothetical protein